MAQSGSAAAKPAKPKSRAMTATAIVIASSLALAVPIGWYLSDTHRGFYHLWKVMAPSADKSLSAPKQNLFSGRVTGSVLEIGAGIGVNVPRIAAELPAVTNVKLVEPNTYMHDDLLAATRSSGLTSVKITADSAVALPDEDDTYDTVISTLVLCSVPDPKKAISELHRVLKPGGRFLFLEHVHGPPSSWERSFQRWVMATGLWSTFGDGCDLERDTGDWILEQEGWDVEIESMTNGTMPVAKTYVVGVATKRAS